MCEYVSRRQETVAALHKRVQMLFQNQHRGLGSTFFSQESKYHLGTCKQECNVQDTQSNPTKPQREHCVQFGVAVFKEKKRISKLDHGSCEEPVLLPGEWKCHSDCEGLRIYIKLVSAGRNWCNLDTIYIYTPLPWQARFKIGHLL